MFRTLLASSLILSSILLNNISWNKTQVYFVWKFFTWYHKKINKCYHKKSWYLLKFNVPIHKKCHLHKYANKLCFQLLLKCCHEYHKALHELNNHPVLRFEHAPYHTQIMHIDYSQCYYEIVDNQCYPYIWLCHCKDSQNWP